MPHTLILATGNAHKARELEALATGLVRLRPLPDCPDVPETGQTFLENAQIKAQACAELPSLEKTDLILAEDSGLVVPTLSDRPDLPKGPEGFPGIYSKRWLALVQGEEIINQMGQAAINQALLALMRPYTRLEDRAAAYYCGMVLYSRQKGVLAQALGICPLIVLTEDEAPRGEQGFGYDPIMGVPGELPLRSVAELSPDEKNAISHRAKAFAQIVSVLGELTETPFRPAG